MSSREHRKETASTTKVLDQSRTGCLSFRETSVSHTLLTGGFSHAATAPASALQCPQSYLDHFTSQPSTRVIFKVSFIPGHSSCQPAPCPLHEHPGLSPTLEPALEGSNHRLRAELQRYLFAFPDQRLHQEWLEGGLPDH